MTQTNHVVVIGGGIAGVSAAYYIALSGAYDRVTLLEAESQLAQHTTGRSAALLTENYGAGPIRPLTTASLGFLHAPPSEFADTPVLSPRGIMTVAPTSASYDELDRQLEEGRTTQQPIIEITSAEAKEIAPHIRFTPEHRVMWEAHAYDIDVAALHQIFVRGMRSLGVEIATSRRFDAARPNGQQWTVDTTAGPLEAGIIVNAAGAWGDTVARGAGVAAVGLEPKRRTAFMVKSPYGDSLDYPVVAGANHDWYLRPDGTQFMCSPADEVPSEPCDARAEELDIARGIEAINQNTLLEVQSITSQWAGLRTFGPDRSMVIGPDPEHPHFVWCVGQGGTGIQTSPGVGQLVADLIVSGQPSDHFDGTGLDVGLLAPERLRTAENR